MKGSFCFVDMVVNFIVNKCHFFLSCRQLDLIFFYYPSSKSNIISISIQSSEHLEHTIWVS